MSERTRDGRRARGDRTRRAIAERAAAIASVDGLSGMTLAALGADLGVSKSSIQAAFPTKESLQLAAIRSATRIFRAEVVTPADEAPEGLERLNALVDGFLSYIERRVLPGGCFMCATFAESDSHPGAIRDALASMRTGWVGLLEHQIAVAQTNGQISTVPSPQLLAFEIDALLASANVARNLTDDVGALGLARELISFRLAR